MPEWMKNALLAVFAVVVLTGAAVAVKDGGGAKVAAGQDALSVLPTASPEANRRIAFLGDSYTSGSAEGGTGQSGWPALVANHFRLYGRLFAKGGTGYLNGQSTAEDFGARIQQIIADNPAVVVVFGSRNDVTYSQAEVEAAAKADLARLRAALPKARIVVIGPAWAEAYPPSGDREGDVQGVKDAAAVVGLPFADPVAEDWLPASHPEWLGSDHVHPNDLGHRHFADLIDAVLTADGVAAAR